MLFRSNAGAYGKIIAEKANLRNLIEAADDILAKSFSPDVESQQMIDYAEQSIFSVAQGRSIKDTSDLRDIVLENIQLMDERARNKGSLTGVPTGLTDLDKRLSGLQKSDMVVLAARPSMGKTAFALCLARNAAIKDNKVMIFSLEKIGRAHV